jgi:hypothetical protein
LIVATDGLLQIMLNPVETPPSLFILVLFGSAAVVTVLLNYMWKTQVPDSSGEAKELFEEKKVPLLGRTGKGPVLDPAFVRI